MHIQCIDCGTQERLKFTPKSNGEYRTKCDCCLRGYAPPLPLQNAKPAPQDDHPLPKIVMQAMHNDGDEVIETIAGLATRLDSQKPKPECGGSKVCYVCKEDKPLNAYRVHQIRMKNGNTEKYYETTCGECMRRIRNAK